MSSIKIIDAFARAASTYDTYADVQFLAAERLAAYMEANTRDLVPGSILEVGCGTGLFTHRMVEFFSDRQFLVTDVCPEMLAKCQERISSRSLGRSNAITFSVLDASVENEVNPCHALVVSAFSLQWMPDLQRCLQALSGQLSEGGKLFFSVPASGSFAEWKAMCQKAGVAFTANDLPEIAQLRAFAASGQFRLSVYEESIKVTYRSLQNFLHSLKSLGAHTTFQEHHLSVAEMRRLLSHAQSAHPEGFQVTYNVLFGNFTRSK